MIENAPANPQPIQTSEVTETKSGNVTIAQLAARLSAQEQAQPSAENVAVAPAAETLSTPAQETAQAATTTAPAETGAAEAAQAATEAPAEPEADDVLSHSTAFSPEQQEIFNRKMAKERALRLDLARELAETKAKLGEVAATPPAQDLPPVTIQPTPDQPLAHITDLNTLQNEFNQTKQVKRLVEQALDSDNGAGSDIGGRVYSRAELKNILRNATVALEDQIPQRGQFLQAKAQSDASAFQNFPFLTDKKSPEYPIVQSALRNPKYSFLHNTPQAMEIMGLQILGLREYNRQQAAKATGTTPAKALPKPPASQTAMGAATGTVRQTTSSLTEQKLANERKQLSAKGGVNVAAAARYLSQRDQLSQTRS